MTDRVKKPDEEEVPSKVKQPRMHSVETKRGKQVKVVRKRFPVHSRNSKLR
jgi:hypothetical protein